MKSLGKRPPTFPTSVRSHAKTRAGFCAALAFLIPIMRALIRQLLYLSTGGGLFFRWRRWRVAFTLTSSQSRHGMSTVAVIITKETKLVTHSPIPAIFAVFLILRVATGMTTARASRIAPNQP